MKVTEIAKTSEKPEVLACAAMAEWVNRKLLDHQGDEFSPQEVAIFEAAVDLFAAVDPSEENLERTRDIRADLARYRPPARG